MEDSDIDQSLESFDQSLESCDSDSFTESCYSFSSMNSTSTASSFSSEPSDEEGRQSDKADNDASFNRPLYVGAKLSVFESYFSVMSYSLRHSLTKQAVSDLVSLIDMHLPSSSMVSLYKLRKFFLNLYEDITFEAHYCCSVCHSPLEDATNRCPHSCAKGSIEFLSISIDAQLRRKFAGVLLLYKSHSQLQNSDL